MSLIQSIIDGVQNDLAGILDAGQLLAVTQSLTKRLSNMPLGQFVNGAKTDADVLSLFVSAKRVEGCSERSLAYYESTLRNMLKKINKAACQITTDDLRTYMGEYQKNGNVSNLTLDNVRRIFSSFFAWLEDEDFILKSPVRRIHKVRAIRAVKEVYSDDFLEQIRDYCRDNSRNLAIVDFLFSTGVRVGELVRLNRADIDFERRECVVLGKGNKERRVYFDARTKVHLLKYLHERKDENEALFVSLLSPYQRLNISGVEIMLRAIGKKLGVTRIHPHKFRRTVATTAIDRGMPIEQVQSMLGHKNIDTTLIYAQVNQDNVRNSHRKFLG